jgi:hypothetical protein
VRAILLVLAASFVLAACGSDERQPAADEPAAPRTAPTHLDRESAIVASISLDWDGEDWEGLKALYGRVVRAGALGDDFGSDPPETLEALVEGLYGGITFADDVEPLLGGEILIGAVIEPAAPDPESFAHSEVVIEYTVPDAAALDRVLDKLGSERKPIPGVDDAESLGGGTAVVGGDTLVIAIDDGGNEDGEALLRERLRDTNGPPLPDAADALAAVRVTPAALGVSLRRDELERALALEPVGTALRGASARLDATDAGLTGSARIDFEGLSDDELPLGPAAGLELPKDEGIASGSTDQSRTTVFLATLARALYPDSRFVREVEAFERAEGIRFEDEVLRAFDGPSVSLMRAESDRMLFAARSTLRDPERMRELLPKLAPVLPDILSGLEALGEVGLGTLLFVAPDAPLTPGAFRLLDTLEVVPAGEDLYEIKGLDPLGDEGLPETLIYGMVGDVFVVASTRELAKEVATIATEPADPAATRTKVDVARLVEQVGEDPEGFVRGVSHAEASGSAQDGDLAFDARLDVP